MAGRKPKAHKDGKIRAATLELMAQGPAPIPGILVSCGCPVKFISPQLR